MAAICCTVSELVKEKKAETRPLWVERRPVPVLVLSPGPITHCDVCDLRMRGVVWCGVVVCVCLCLCMGVRYVPQRQERERERENIISSKGGRAGEAGQAA